MNAAADAPGRSCRIRIIEDNPGDVWLARQAIGETSFRADVDAVEDGQEALDDLRKVPWETGGGPPDVILLDLNLPRLDGREFLSRLRAREGWKAIPVIVWTTSRAEKDIRQAYELHANCYVTKPAGLDDFLSTIRSVLNFWFGIARLPSAN